MNRAYGPGTILLVAVLAGLLVGGAAVVALNPGGSDGSPSDSPIEQELTGPEVSTFESADDYRSYLQRGAGGTTSFGPTVGAQRDVVAEQEDAGGVDDGAADGGGGGDEIEDGTSTPRSSETNVQVEGIAEPDVLQTDGEWAYYAGWERSHRERGVGGPAVIDTNEPASPELSGSIPHGDRLVLADDTLVAFGSDAIYGYDVSDPESPEQTWERDLDHRIETARMVNGTVYVVLADRPSLDDPCPVRPMGDDGPGIPCSDVYRPAETDGGDTTYTALSIDVETGQVGDEASFVGNGANTVVYVSHDAIYLTFEDSPVREEVRLDYLLGPGSEHLDQQAIDRLEEIQSYDLTPRSTGMETSAAIEARLSRLPEERRQAVAESIHQGWEDYVDERQRELLRTGIVRIDVDDESLAVTETGEVPGRVLNQFSVSDRQGHLHVATTINPRGSQWENDLYTLDSDLEVADAETGMGTDQRIYSVRYVGDRAYITTFRQIDPFHVIDVSDPEDIEEVGELELPGYSDYLHPLGEDRILGIGERDGQVTATVFDASDPTDPEIEDDLQLDDRWTAVSQSHHAFLLDERHGVFFLPGSEGGHVVAYEDGLELQTTVDTDGPAVRAAYVGDHLYVFGTDELVVVDETDWSTVDRLDL